MAWPPVAQALTTAMFGPRSLAARGDREVGVAVVPTRVLAIHVLGGVEALHLTGDVDLVIGRVEEGDVGDAGTTVDQRVPARLGPDADRRDDAQACDGDAPSVHAAGSSGPGRPTAPSPPGASMAWVCAPGTIRRISPLRTRPGPTSMKSVTPLAALRRPA